MKSESVETLIRRAGTRGMRFAARGDELIVDYDRNSLADRRVLGDLRRRGDELARYFAPKLAAGKSDAERGAELDRKFVGLMLRSMRSGLQ